MDDKLRYRAMLEADFDAAVALWRSCDGVGLRDSDSPAGLGTYLARNPGLSFVAEQETRLVGTVLAGHDGRRGYLQHLAVADELRRHGIGSRLLELGLEALRREGILKTHVHVFADNARARLFWEARGWRPRTEIALYSCILGDNDNI